ncbi:hypothetical protein MTBBW1_2610006 [Desulfamplus magnetovallimortis]|uniref:Uncharacterized protein n=1 Tax=Desulfamplus magnetovallimortis TaxID=1246637 RepID=A0A1W1HF84_9BACT|nr:hypothetical protein MTBBW1_2610006 [Desulfamplus magnetovallimortis]
MDIYYHWVAGGKKNEVDRLDDAASKRNQIQSNLSATR